MFSERMKKKREDKGLTQAELARRIGVGRDLYNKYERAGTQPSNETLVLLAKELDTTVDYLLTGGENAKPTDIPPPAYDNEALELMEEMHKRPELKTLFSTSKKATKEDIEFVDEFLRRMTKDSD